MGESSRATASTERNNSMPVEKEVAAPTVTN